MHLQEHPVAERLGKLAEAGVTGALHVPGDPGGRFYFRDGDVIYAESAGTPGPGRGLKPLPADLWILAVSESTIDAAQDLLSEIPPQPAPRFRSAESPGVGEVARIPVAELLAEVARRQEVARQLSATLTPDTVVALNPDLASRNVRVSGLQWAILIRVGDRSTPRSISFDLQRSVFATAIEVFRLVSLNLLTVAGESGGSGSERPGFPSSRPVVSFVQAVPRRAGPRISPPLSGSGLANDRCGETKPPLSSANCG